MTRALYVSDGLSLPLEQLARRHTGIIERVYAGARYGVILALTGERVFFRRRNIIGNGTAWVPRVGETVAFARVLDRRGLKAFKVRPLGTRSIHGA